MPKPKKIVFITKPSDQEPWPEGVPTQATPLTRNTLHKTIQRGKRALLKSDQPQAFEQSYYRPIEIPKEFENDPLLSDSYRLAVHEVSHALARLIFCGWVDVVILTSSFASGGVGRSYGKGGTGEDAARVCIAGLSGERLVAGEPLYISGFTNDIERTRDHLREAGITEERLDGRTQELFIEMMQTFAAKWLPAIKTASYALTRRGILDGATLLEIFSDAQRDASDAGTLTPSV